MVNIEEYINNPIKKHIIGLLMKNKRLRYSELMPKDVDNVLFNYHLQHLVRNGLVNKDENEYSLSSEGLQLTSNFTDSGLYFPKFVCRFKLYLIQDNKVLFQERKRSPWNGDVTPLYSKVMYGEGVEDRADQRMKEKADVLTHMKWIGTIRTLTFNSKKDLVDDSLYFACYANTFDGTINTHDDSGNKLIWYTFEEAIQQEKKNRGSGHKSVEVLQRLKNKNYEPFVFEEHIQAENM